MPLEVTSDNYGYFKKIFSTKTTLILTSNSQGLCSRKGHKLTKLENDEELDQIRACISKIILDGSYLSIEFPAKEEMWQSIRY